LHRPGRRECEQTWLVAGGSVAQLLASPATTALLASLADKQRGGIAALLM
jgi:hypothetical protein